MKEYRYDTGYYLVSVLGPNILMTCLLIWAVYCQIQGESSLLQKLVITIVPFLLFSSLLAMNQPRLITDDDETLTFYGFFQKHEYKWSEIETIRIRNFIMTDKVLVRIGKDRLLGGRYWLDTDSLRGCRELLDKMIPYDPLYERYNRKKMNNKAASATAKGKKR
jgi:hypothetical protein